MSKTKEHIEKSTQTFDLDPESFGGEDFPSYFPEQRSESVIKTGPRDIAAPFITLEEEATIKKFFENNPALQQSPLNSMVFENSERLFHENEPWIQTYSGIRFNPTNPVVGSIIIQDIAHSLSMQCRFSGHVKKFYSVAQHSVLVSYLCDEKDRLWGLLHDASEAYLVDVPRPLKHSGKFDAYIEFETVMQAAICKRFGLPEKEPSSVKTADKIMLSTEARDLMGPLHVDWRNPVEAAPFIVDPLPQQVAKNLFMKRFYELTGRPEVYAHYLSTQG